MRKIILAGNPNCGKTTLFNLLTGANQHVGNWSGVTVEKREGTVKNGQAVLTDLPGIYSLSDYTQEERIARDCLFSGESDVVINLLDGTSLERGLYLTLQLLELGLPIVVAVGMMDAVRAGGGSVDIEKLGQLLGVPIIPISARSGENISTLLNIVSKEVYSTHPLLFYPLLEQALRRLSKNLPDEGSSVRYQAICLLESSLADVSPEAEEVGSRLRAELERATGMDAMTLVADARYRLIDAIVAETVQTPQKSGTWTDRIDSVVLDKVLAFPIFAGIMAIVFWVSFGGIGSVLRQIMEWNLQQFSQLAVGWLTRAGVFAPIIDLAVSGTLGGMGTVLIFLPQIALIFLFLTLLEECGYLARAAFLLDWPLRALGLTGKSFIPMLTGLGCTTPAVMAARTLENDRDRQMTIILTPYFPCSAKLPIYALFSAVFFPAQQGIAVVLLYLLGIAAAVVCGLFLRKGPYRGPPTPFLMEFPPYRVPLFWNVLRNAGEKCWDFLKKAGTLIFLMSLGIWVLQHFDANLQFTWNADLSLFSQLGGCLAPLFVPLGFGFREAAVALLAGLASKEAVVAALSVFCGAQGSMEVLQSSLRSLFTPLSASSFLVFCALYMPCMSAFATIRKELHSTGKAVIAMAGQTMFAYAAALAVYQLGMLWINLFF